MYWTRRLWWLATVLALIAAAPGSAVNPVSAAAASNPASTAAPPSHQTLTPATGSDPTIVEQQVFPPQVWMYVGPPCPSLTARCPGWQLIDDNPNTQTVITAPSGIFEQQTGGYLWKYTGVPCSPAGCRGWVLIDRNPNTSEVIGGAFGLFELQFTTGLLFVYNGSSVCTATGCPGWTPIDHNPATTDVAVDARTVYEFQGPRGSGRLYKYVGPSCPSLTAACPGWRLIDDNPNTTAIVGGSAGLFQWQQATGYVFAYNGTSICAPIGCPGWTPLDHNPRTAGVSAQ